MEPAARWPGASPEAVQFHYDLGNDFYRLWLDPTMSYSAGLWEPDTPDDTLEAAQIRKLDYHIQQAGAHGARRVLDIGCGWGGLLRRLVTTYGVEQAVGLTLSHEQARWIAAAADPRIAVRLESWWDHRPDAAYDAIISIEALEHFARPEYDTARKVEVYQRFFARCHKWLKPGGKLSLQVFGYGTGFIGPRELSPVTASLFPETNLPSLYEIVTAAVKLFNIVSVRNDAGDIRRSGEALFPRLEASRGEAVALIGADRFDLYRQFVERMAQCDPEGDLALWRITFRRAGSAYSEIYARLLAALGS